MVLTAGSLIAMYDRYHGSCMVPYHDLTALMTISSLFVIGFVWAATELVLLLHRGRSWPVALALGIFAYVAVGAGVWLSNPESAVRDDPGGEFRVVTSAVWPAGILLEAGAFSDYECGY